jgi:RND family efflux transporter MFP subunit
MSISTRPRTTRARRLSRSLAAATFLTGLAVALPVQAAPLEAVSIVETKAVYGTVSARDVVPARARTGGTLVSLSVEEGAMVAAGAVIGLVTDDKIALQLDAVDARINALDFELANARSELDRATELVSRGAATQQRVDQTRTQVDVLTSQIAAAQAERAVLVQQQTEGEIVAPISGRVLTAPVTPGSVVMPGEPVVTIAGGGLFLRLSLPERHAELLEEGAPVSIGRSGSDENNGRIARVYPQIERGRVVVDVEVAELGDYFVGSRTLVEVPVGERNALLVDPAAIHTRFGVDFVTIATPQGPREVTVVTGTRVATAAGERVEIVSGLRAGDEVIAP